MHEKSVWLITGAGRGLGVDIAKAALAAGADAVRTFEAKANSLLSQAQAHRELSGSLAYDDA